MLPYILVIVDHFQSLLFNVLKFEEYIYLVFLELFIIPNQVPVTFNRSLAKNL